MTALIVPHKRQLAIALAILVLVLLLVVCEAAFGDNYRFARTRADDALAASLAVRASDVPGSWHLHGGRTKPDETPNTDSCDGYYAQESDLVVTGDARTVLKDARRSIQIESRVAVFRTSSMAESDLTRSEYMLTPHCLAVVARHHHVKLVGRPREIGSFACACQTSAGATLESATKTPGIDAVVVAMALQEGRFEVEVTTILGKSINETDGTTLRLADTIEDLALQAVERRLRTVR